MGRIILLHQLLFQTTNCISFKRNPNFTSQGVIHHSFATIHPYINTHLTHLIDCLVKCDELTVNMIGGSSHFDGYTPARPRPMKTLITLMPSQTNCMFVKKKGKCLDIKIMTQSHKTIVESIVYKWEIINQMRIKKAIKK